MTTPAQREFLLGHIEVLRDQTESAREEARDLLQQVTADRLLRLLVAAKVWAENLPDDGDQASVWGDVSNAAILVGLGFELPPRDIIKP